MSANRARAAVTTFIADQQRIVSCLTQAAIVRRRTDPPSFNLLTLGEQYAPLDGEHPLAFSLRLGFSISEHADLPDGWQVRTTCYWYQIRQRDGPEVIAFHWHPVGLGQVEFPIRTSGAVSA